MITLSTLGAGQQSAFSTLTKTTTHHTHVLSQHTNTHVRQFHVLLLKVSSLNHVASCRRCRMHFLTGTEECYDLWHFLSITHEGSLKNALWKSCLSLKHENAFVMVKPLRTWKSWDSLWSTKEHFVLEMCNKRKYTLFKQLLLPVFFEILDIFDIVWIFYLRTIIDFTNQKSGSLIFFVD